jgi:hypothetical protein
LPVEVDGRDGEDRERRTSYRAQGVDRESVQTWPSLTGQPNVAG